MPPKKPPTKIKDKTDLKSSSETPSAISPKTKKTLEETIAQAEGNVDSKKKPKKSLKRPRKNPPPEETSSEEESEEDTSESEEEQPSADLVKKGQSTYVFNPTSWKPFFKKGEPVRMVTIGQANSGKSYFIKYLLTSHLFTDGPNGHYNYCIIVSESYDERSEYEKIAKAFGIPVAVEDKWPLGTYDRLKRSFVQRTEAGLPPLNVLLIVDDFGQSDYTQGGKGTIGDEFTKCFTLGRHSNISVLVLAQSPRMVGHTSKGSASLICFTKLATAQQKEVVLKQVLSGSVDLPSRTTGAQEMRFYKDILAKFAHDQGDMIIIEYRPEEQRGNQEKRNLYKYRAPKKELWHELPKIED